MSLTAASYCSSPTSSSIGSMTPVSPVELHFHEHWFGGAGGGGQRRNRFRTDVEPEPFEMDPADERDRSSSDDGVVMEDLDQDEIAPVMGVLTLDDITPVVEDGPFSWAIMDGVVGSGGAGKSVSPSSAGSAARSGAIKRGRWDTMNNPRTSEEGFGRDVNKSAKSFYGDTVKTSPLGTSRQYNISPRAVLKASPTIIRTYGKSRGSSLLQDISPSLINAATTSPNRNVFKTPKKFVLSLTVSPEKIGFPNTGNTCYLNAVLQCLFALPAFVESVVAWNDDMDGDRDKENAKYPLMCATRRVIRKKMAGRQNDIEPALTSLLDAFARGNKDFKGFDQHDAQEFLLKYFDDLQKEAAEFAKSNGKYAKEGSNDEKNPQSQDPQSQDLPTPVTTNFFFRTNTTRVCPGCDKSTETMSDNLILPLQLTEEAGDDRTLQGMLRRALSTKLERKCDHCNKKVTDSSSEERMLNLPRHLLLLLPRAYFSNETKDAAKSKTEVKIPQVLNLTKYVAGDGSEVFKYIDLDVRKKQVAVVGVKDGGKNFIQKRIVNGELLDLSDKSNPSGEFISLNDSLSDDEAMRRALEISLTESPTCRTNSMQTSSMSGGSATEASSSSLDNGLTGMTEEDMLEMALKNSMVTAMVEDADAACNVSQVDGTTQTPDVSPIKQIKMMKMEETKLSETFQPIAVEATQADALSQQDLDLLASAKLNPDHEYRLTGVVNHLGDLANMGHYVADIFAKGRWRRYNDTHIRPIATEEMLNRSSVDGYLFFYTHDAYCTGSRRMEDGKDDKENL